MHPHAQLITSFYEAFARRDAAAMATLYGPTATFSDPVFPHLEGRAIVDMWTMLTARARDFRLTFSDVAADDRQGSARWEAWYLFGGKRPVHNVISARFEFTDGRVSRHEDSFDFWRWSRQALGPAGAVLGWSGYLRSQVQGRSRAALEEWQARTGGGATP